MFNLFRRNRSRIESFNFLHTDIHSHLIPGIDDGAPDLAASLKLIKGLQSLGFRALITTPHVMTDMYPNTPKVILEGLEEVRSALKNEGIDMPIAAAAEYLMDEAFAEKIDAGSLLTLWDQYVLVEMSFISPAPNLETLLFQMQTKGYRPVMAHPERYMYLATSDLDHYKRLKDRGCLLQLNLLSLLGYYGKEVKRTATSLLKADLYDLAGTDLHHERHEKALRDLLADSRAANLLAKHHWKNTEIYG